MDHFNLLVEACYMKKKDTHQQISSKVYDTVLNKKKKCMKRIGLSYPLSLYPLISPSFCFFFLLPPTLLQLYCNSSTEQTRPKNIDYYIFSSIPLKENQGYSNFNDLIKK